MISRTFASVDRRQHVGTLPFFSLLQIAALSGFIFLVFYEISFSIPSLDDYSRAAEMAKFGFQMSMRHEYFGWSGRFASTSLEYILNYQIANKLAYPSFLALICIGSTALSSFAIRAVFDINRLGAITLAIMLEAVRWCVSMSPEQSFFWLTGSLENYFAISAYACLCAITLRLAAQDPRPAAGTIFGLSIGSFLAVGFHELFGICFVVSLSLLVLAVWVRDRRIKPWPMIVIAAAALGLATVVLAPGNAVRAGMMPKNFDRLQAVLSSAENLLPQFANLAKAVIILAGAALFACRQRISLSSSVAGVVSARWIAVAATVSVFLMFGIATAIQSRIEYRTVDGILYVALVSFYFCIGIVAHRTGGASRQGSLSPPASALLAILFCIGIVATPNVVSAYDDSIHVAHSFRRAYGQRLKLLKTVRGRADAHVVLAPFTPLPRVTFFGDIASDPGNYVNKGVAGYYGIADIRLGAENKVSFGADTPAKP